MSNENEQQQAQQPAQVRTPVRTRPFKPTVSMSLYKEDYDKLVDYAYNKQVTLRQAFADAVAALGIMDERRAGDRQAKAAKAAAAKAKKAKKK